MKKVYKVGTPWNNVVPSRSNSNQDVGNEECREEVKRSESFHENDLVAEPILMDSVESTTAQVQPDISSACKYEAKP